MAEKRQSVRASLSDKKLILDESARKRRQRKALDALEQDNFQDDPHADLKMSKKAPKFGESINTNEKGPGNKKKRKSKVEYLRQRLKKTFAALLEEEQSFGVDTHSYLSASVPPSTFPPRHFCAVCGFTSNYTCVACGARYCSVKCLGTHQDTRCLKWTA